MKQRRNTLTIELPAGAIEAALGRVLLPENEGVYDKAADGTELSINRQKARRYLEASVYVPAGEKWLVERTATDERERKMARLEEIGKIDTKAIQDAHKREKEKEALLVELEGDVDETGPELSG